MMIEFLKGTVSYVETDYIAMEVNGVGYQIFVPNPFAWKEEQSVCLYTHFVVREDAQLLYGFSKKEERDLFRILLDVSGIGPKGALGILASTSPKQLVQAIQTEDVKSLTRLPGVGKKTAQRMVLDLKDKLDKWAGLEREAAVPLEESMLLGSASKERDVIAALVALGYNEEEAEWATRQAIQGLEPSEMEMEKWIKMALQKMMMK